MDIVGVFRVVKYSCLIVLEVDVAKKNVKCSVAIVGKTSSEIKLSIIHRDRTHYCIPLSTPRRN